MKRKGIVKRMIMMKRVIYAFLLLISPMMCYANDNLLVHVENPPPLAYGDDLHLAVEITNNTHEDICIPYVISRKPIMPGIGKIIINNALMFDPEVKGYEYTLPPYLHISGKSADPLRVTFVIPFPYTVVVQGIANGQLFNPLRDPSVISQFQALGVLEDWLTPYKKYELKPGSYELQVIVGSFSKEDIEYYEDVLLQQEVTTERRLSSDPDGTVLYGKRVKYIKEKERFSASETVRILITGDFNRPQQK